MDYDKLIERLNAPDCCDKCTYEEKRACAGSAKCVLSEYSAAALSALQAENEELRAELADLRAQWDMYGGDEGITATYAELERVKAEMEGQYGIPPVKMHQKLFRVFNGEIYEETVCGAIWEPLMPRPRWKVFVMGSGCVYYWDDVLGKTVFLTRAEAETALRREQDE